MLAIIINKSSSCFDLCCVVFLCCVLLCCVRQVRRDKPGQPYFVFLVSLSPLLSPLGRLVGLWRASPSLRHPRSPPPLHLHLESLQRRRKAKLSSGRGRQTRQTTAPGDSHDHSRRHGHKQHGGGCGRGMSLWVV